MKPRSPAFVWGTALLALLSACGRVAAPPPAPGPLGAQDVQSDLSLTPAMGWSSWQYYGGDVTPQNIRDAADGLVRPRPALGGRSLKDLGYTYLNIDLGWWTQQGSPANSGRNADGSIRPNPGWDMAALADYLHARGLKAGIYTDKGANGCYDTWHVGWGSAGHEVQDMTTFARWGYDYVKVDNCSAGSGGRSTQQTYQLYRQAIDSVRGIRPMVFSICNWGEFEPQYWAPQLGNFWRTTGDIAYLGSTRGALPYSRAQWGDVLDHFDRSWLPFAVHPGSFADPDFLMVGDELGLTPTERQSYVSLWSMLNAPLILSANLANQSDATLNLLGNPEVIAVDQDARGTQAQRQGPPGGVEVWVKELAQPGARAVMLLNRGESSASRSFNWSDLGLTGSATVRDLWARTDRGSANGSYSATVPPHGVVLLRIVGTPLAVPSLPGAQPIVSQTGAGVLDVDNLARVPSSPVLLWQTNGGLNQQWALQPTGDGYYYVTSALNGYVLDVDGRLNGGQGTRGTPVGVFPRTGNPNQQWAKVDVGGGAFKLKSRQSGLMLDVDGRGFGPHNGSMLQVWDDNGNANQRWTTGGVVPPVLPVNSFVSLKATTPGFDNRFIRHMNDLAYTEVVDGGSSALLKQDATWKVTAGLADATYFSFESRNFPGQYLRHFNFRLRKDPRDGSAVFDQDATFCARPGLSGQGVSLESRNFPGRYLRHYNSELWLAQNGGPLTSDNPTSFNQDVSWTVSAPWAP